MIVCPVYAAGEAPIDGIDSGRIASEMRDRGHRGAETVASLDEATTRLVAIARPGDIVISLGAGDVNRVCGELLTRLGAST